MQEDGEFQGRIEFKVIRLRTLAIFINGLLFRGTKS